MKLPWRALRRGFCKVLGRELEHDDRYTAAWSFEISRHLETAAEHSDKQMGEFYYHPLSRKPRQHAATAWRPVCSGL
jgi:hypothetical protein